MALKSFQYFYILLKDFTVLLVALWIAAFIIFPEMILSKLITVGSSTTSFILVFIIMISVFLYFLRPYSLISSKIYKPSLKTRSRQSIRDYFSPIGLLIVSQILFLILVNSKLYTLEDIVVLLLFGLTHFIVFAITMFLSCNYIKVKDEGLQVTNRKVQDKLIHYSEIDDITIKNDDTFIEYNSGENIVIKGKIDTEKLWNNIKNKYLSECLTDD